MLQKFESYLFIFGAAVVAITYKSVNFNVIFTDSQDGVNLHHQSSPELAPAQRSPQSTWDRQRRDEENERRRVRMVSGDNITRGHYLILRYEHNAPHPHLAHQNFLVIQNDP